MASGVLLLMVAGTGSGTLWAQGNFSPLERGDFTEEQEQLIVLRGLEAHLDYAARLLDETGASVPSDHKGTYIHQDIRLELQTLFHQDVALHLVLEPEVLPVNDSNIREDRDSSRNRLPEGQTTGVNVREAFLRYNFNPNSGLLLGTQEVSLGDRRGKTFNGIAPGFTYDCKMGTWCSPAGGIRINDDAADWIYHLAFGYTAWESEGVNYRNALEVEVFRLWYTEHNIPLGSNFGPAVFTSDTPTVANDTQAVDNTSQPIYYDAKSHDYYGVRVNWEADTFFFNFDLVGSQGTRVYHTYRDPDGGVSTDLDFSGAGTFSRSKQQVRGHVWETEIGVRGQYALAGLRAMEATGDGYRDTKNGDGVLRDLRGYYEVTPGTYKGTRLYFNGGDSQIDDGAGLGHSVNNTRLLGFFADFDDPEGNKMAYSMGLYHLSFIHGIPDASGQRRRYIGLEWDNVITFYLRKSIRLQAELNFLQQGEAFRYDDYSTPDNKRKLLSHAIARFVYQF